MPDGLPGAPATIFLGRNTPAIKAEKLKQWGAKVVIEGAVWDDANRAALEMARAEKLPYFHPFADPQVIAGQGNNLLRNSGRDASSGYFAGGDRRRRLN